jgi:hypothetical protein
VVTRLNQPVSLYRNISPQSNHWLAFRLKGSRSNRDAIGARIHLVGASRLEQWNHVTTSAGYAGSSDKTVYFGLGEDTTAALVEIRWPDGAVQELRDVAANRYVTVEEPNPA